MGRSNTVPCPHCGKEVYDEAEQCPYCESYISEDDTPRARRPWWLVVGVVLCLYAVYRWVTGG